VIYQFVYSYSERNIGTYFCLPSTMFDVDILLSLIVLLRTVYTYIVPTYMWVYVKLLK